jgi:hypothetical protein
MVDFRPKHVAKIKTYLSLTNTCKSFFAKNFKLQLAGPQLSESDFKQNGFVSEYK